MKKNKYVPMLISQIAVLLFVITTSGCYMTLAGCFIAFQTESDKQQILSAYTNSDGNYKFYTFTAEIREIYIYGEEGENEKLYYLNVDKEDFERQYGNDETVLKNGEKLWENSYGYFCGTAFYFIDSNYSIVKDGGGSEFLKEGTKVTVTANNFNGIIALNYPILSLEIDGMVYLDFETGLENYLAYVRAGFKEN